MVIARLTKAQDSYICLMLNDKKLDTETENVKQSIKTCSKKEKGINMSYFPQINIQ